MLDFNLKYYSELANKILSAKTKYQNDKDIIHSAFAIKDDPLEKVTFRLTIIDSYYSTQMNKRYFGIEEIAENLVRVASDDIQLKDRLLHFSVYPQEDMELIDLFKKPYGYRKTGARAGIAPSLLTKYAYFLTRYNFPIFDSLVLYSYPILRSNFSELDLGIIPKQCNEFFFRTMNEFNSKSGINDFDKLDNLLWLFGKIRKGSFSLILNRDIFIALTQKLNIPKGLKSKEIDDYITSFLKDVKKLNSLKDVLTEELIEFIAFCFCKNGGRNFA